MLKTVGWLMTASLVFSSGCATASYAPPGTGAGNASNEVTVERSFDEVWTALVDYASSTFFAIKNFEKASGLMTVSFGSGSLTDFINCGTWNALAFRGPYVNYLKTGADTQFDGSMNIRVKAVTAMRTSVRVNARYVLTSVRTAPGGAPVRDTWAFDSGGSATVAVQFPAAGTTPARTCAPTGLAEETILKGIAAR